MISALQKVWSDGPVAMDGGPTKKKDPEKPVISALQKVWSEGPVAMDGGHV